jgi:hypothetical protein
MSRQTPSFTLPAMIECSNSTELPSSPANPTSFPGAHGAGLHQRYGDRRYFTGDGALGSRKNNFSIYPSGLRAILARSSASPHCMLWPQNNSLCVSQIPSSFRDGFEISDRTKLTRIRAPKCGTYFCASPERIYPFAHSWMRLEDEPEFYAEVWICFFTDLK